LNNALFTATVSLALLALSPISARAQDRFTLTPISLPSGASAAFATSINDRGQVAGYAYLPGGVTRSFVYSAGNVTDIGSFNTLRIAASSINNQGDVVGFFDNNGNGRPHAFIFRNGSLNALDADPTVDSNATGINNNGVTIGSVRSFGGTTDVFLSNGTGLIRQGLSPGGTWPISGAAINDSSQFTGTVFSSANPRGRAYISSAGTINTLGTLGGTYSVGTSISNFGAVAGYSSMAGDQSTNGFLFANNQLTRIASLAGPQSAGYQPGLQGSSWAAGINDSAQVVGSYGYNGYESRAFLFSNGNLIDLSTSINAGSNGQWVVVQADDINNAGQIVGYGYRIGEYISTPIILTPVPEATAGALMLLGLASITLVRRKQSHRLIAHQNAACRSQRVDA
jgi:probable HAF family extracellular repeat protein